MTARPGNRWRQADWLLASLSVAVLLACLFYTLAYVFLVPYPGITLNAGWVVTAIDPGDAHPGWREADRNSLLVGDQLLAIGDLTYEGYWSDRRLVPFGGYGPGDWTPITLQRDGRPQAIRWLMPAITGANQAWRLVGQLFYLPFWLVGTAVLLLLRPRDRRWALLVSFNYATAFWLAVGMVSQLGVAASSLVLHATTWLLVPVYLHLHLLVPRPLLGPRAWRFLLPLYVLAATLAALELFQLLPSFAYALGLLLAIPGSLGLLAFRLFGRSSRAARLAAGGMLAGIGLGLGPGLVLGLIPSLLNPGAPEAAAMNMAMLGIPLLPLAYTYTLYKRTLGPLEFRANRLLSLYSFALLYLTAFIVAFLVGQRWTSSPDEFVAFILVVSTVFVVAAPMLRTRFQRLADRLAYGTRHNPEELLRVFATRIPAASGREALAHLLADEVAPILLIRQSALVLLGDDQAELVYAHGVSQHGTPETPGQVQRLLAEAGRYQPPPAEVGETQEETPGGDGFDWVRLAIPLETQERTLGVWLFGRRDPDDYYPQPDIALLTALAGQVAVALENTRLYTAVQQELVERRHAEDSARQAEQRYRSLFEEAPVMYVITRSQEGAPIVADCNQLFLSTLGYTRTEVLGRPLADFYTPASRTRLLEDGYRRVLEGHFVAEERELLTRDGRVVQTVLQARPETDADGRASGSRATYVDITERKQVEEAKERAEVQLRQAQKLEAIGTLAGGVAHDFNNLLTIIQGYAELAMRETDEAEPLFRNLKHVHRAAVRAADLTRQLLLFSSREPMEFTPLNVNQVVEELLKMLWRLIGEDVAIETDLAPDLWAIQGDAGNVEQIVMNLVANARDAMPGGGTLIIHTENVTLGEDDVRHIPEARPGRFVRLSVADTGVGMSQEVLPRIFEPFFTTKEVGKGTGLGLSVVYGIVKQHDGWVTVYSEPGRGSTFRVYLPASSTRPIVETRPTIPLSELRGHGERVLLVEDEDGVRDFTAWALRDNGYQVFAAASLTEALDIYAIEQGQLHLVFSDVVLPDGTGLALADTLRARQPGLRFLLSSGYADQKSQWPLIQERGLRFLQKPYASPDLLRAVKEALS